MTLYHSLRHKDLNLILDKFSLLLREAPLHRAETVQRHEKPQKTHITQQPCPHQTHTIKSHRNFNYSLIFNTESSTEKSQRVTERTMHRLKLMMR